VLAVGCFILATNSVVYWGGVGVQVIGGGARGGAEGEGAAAGAASCPAGGECSGIGGGGGGGGGTMEWGWIVHGAAVGFAALLSFAAGALVATEKVCLDRP